MRKVVVDKIASVTRGVPLRRDLRITDSISCQEGDLVVVRVLNSKSQYNTLELTTGRFAALKPGDVIVGALGFRNAVYGYAGTIPTSLSPGDKTNLLNIGGVVGNCTSFSPTVGPPFEVEVLGQVLSFPELGSRKGVPANIGQHSLPIVEGLSKLDAPVIGVVGTCMNSGKTEACLALIQQLVRAGLKVSAAKTTGVSLRRDVLAMEDAGAERTLIFTDFGVVTTSALNAAALTCSMLAELDRSSPDVIVVELGDGLMGDYGVDAILSSPALESAFGSLILAANDPVGAWGGVEMMRQRYGLTPAMLTGPATDNQAGTRILEAQLGVPAINARTHPERFAAPFVSSVGVLSHAK